MCSHCELLDGFYRMAPDSIRLRNTTRLPAFPIVPAQNHIVKQGAHLAVFPVKVRPKRAIALVGEDSGDIRLEIAPAPAVRPESQIFLDVMSPLVMRRHIEEERSKP